MRRSVLLLALAALSLAFAPAPLPRPKADPTKEDLKKMQGEWVLVSRAVGGRPQLGLSKVVIAGDRLTYHRPDGTVATRWSLSLEAKKAPRWVDSKREWPDSSYSARGIYDLKRDTLTICLVYDKTDRPADFDGSKPSRWLLVLKRAKR
jgi:uncharacterized protein (TIGR03067 family)